MALELGVDTVTTFAPLGGLIVNTDDDTWPNEISVAFSCSTGVLSLRA